MEEIGSGSFTTAFRLKNGKVLLKSKDPIKQHMAEGNFPKSRLFPTVTLVKEATEFCRARYEMEYYEQPANIYEALNSSQKEFYDEHIRYFYVITGYNRIVDAFSKLPEKFAYEREIMLEAVHSLKEYGNDIIFENPLQNLAIKNGQLVLLDCFFLRSVLTEVRENAPHQSGTGK